MASGSNTGVSSTIRSTGQNSSATSSATGASSIYSAAGSGVVASVSTGYSFPEEGSASIGGGFSNENLASFFFLSFLLLKVPQLSQSMLSASHSSRTGSSTLQGGETGSGSSRTGAGSSKIITGSLGILPFSKVDPGVEIKAKFYPRPTPPLESLCYPRRRVKICIISP